MFTNNYILYKNNAFLGNKFSTKTTEGTNMQIDLSYCYCNDIGTWMHNAIANGISVYESSRRGYVQFGTGSTPATKEDYKLESPITSGISFTNPSSAQIGKIGDGKYCAWASYTVKNTSGDIINIYEIGMFLGLGNSSSKFYNLLVERTVFTEPIVLGIGEEKIITYKITFNQTLNIESEAEA